jgi:hypothetical protein
MSLNQNKGGIIAGILPQVVYSATYQINSGAVIADGATVTETVIFTGALITDPNIALTVGLTLVSASVTAADTVTVTWANRSGASITPPASGTWYCAILAPFYKG